MVSIILLVCGILALCGKISLTAIGIICIIGSITLEIVEILRR